MTLSEGPRLGRKHRLLLSLERFSRQRYGVVFLLALVAAGAGAWLGSRLTLESDILALIPAGNPRVDAFKRTVADFGSISYLILVLDAGEGRGADELEDFADPFAERLATLDDLVGKVEYRLHADADFLDLFYDNALLFLPPDDLDALAAKLTDEAIARQVRQDRMALASPTAPLTQERLVLDPLDIMPLFLNRLLEQRGAFRIDVSDGYYLSEDGRKLIMLVEPTSPWQDLDFDHRLLAAVRGVEAEVRASLPEDAAGIEVRYSGHYAIAVDEAVLIKKDIRFNMIFSLAAVSALYWICYRRFAALLYSSVPLLVGQALTFGLCFFVLRSLNASSSAFTALLMGLGTDFVIVMYARYVEERRLGRGLTEATERMVGETGLGVFTGAITSAGTFYAMCISEFRGLRDLGFLIGSGILLCAVAIVFLVPAMIKWNEGVRRRKTDSVRKLHVQSFLLEYLIPFSARHRRMVLAGVAVLTVAAGWLALSLEFDDTVQVLRSNRSPAFKVQEEIARDFGASPSYMMAIAEGTTRDEAMARAARIAHRLEPYVSSGVVASYDSVLGYLPPADAQLRILQALRDDATGAFDPVRIRRSFLAALDANGFRAEAFAGFLDRLDRFLVPSRPVRLEDFERRGLDALIERYVRKDESGVRIVTYMFLSDPRWKRAPPPGLVEDLVADDPRIVVTGTNVVGQEFRRIFTREAPRALALGFVVVFLLLWIDFRSLELTSIALLQLVCGVVMMLGLMKVAGIHLNYVNAFVATMILGVGIDYSIHLVHRMSWSRGRVEPGLLETGKAVVIAALTNVAGFGTLTLGSYPALRSFGLVAVLGSITCLFTALTLVPAMMARRE